MEYRPVRETQPGDESPQRRLLGPVADEVDLDLAPAMRELGRRAEQVVESLVPCERPDGDDPVGRPGVWLVRKGPQVQPVVGDVDLGCDRGSDVRKVLLNELAGGIAAAGDPGRGKKPSAQGNPVGGGEPAPRRATP